MAGKDKILLVEDSVGVRDMLTLLLERNGYEVVGAGDAEEFNQHLDEKPDLIILDLYLSGADGRDLCRKLKADRATSHIPIIVVSAAFNVEKSVMESGADIYLEKPFEIKTMLARIDELIQHEQRT